MSRSRKKVPGWVDSAPWAKRWANKRVRRFKGDLPNGKGYRKLYDPWHICDWRRLYWGEQELWELENSRYGGTPRYRAYMK